MKDVEALTAAFELLDEHPFKLPHAVQVVHDDEGYTWGLTSMGTTAWGMPTEDFEALRAYDPDATVLRTQ